jgi:hypothetical protein
MAKLSKNRKKKLRKRKKKQKELLEKQLYEVEGLSMSMNANVDSKIPESVLNEKVAPIPRLNPKSFGNNSNGVDKEHAAVEEEHPKDENAGKKKKKKVSLIRSLEIVNFRRTSGSEKGMRMQPTLFRTNLLIATTLRKLKMGQKKRATMIVRIKMGSLQTHSLTF